jgi:hypothetical protein
MNNHYSKHHELITRVLAQIALQKDITQFGQMLVDCYDAGYTKAVEDYRKAVEKVGFKVNIVAEKTN